MRRTSRSLLIIGVVAAMAVAGTVFAYAGGWALADNTTSLTAKVAKMPRGVEPSVAKQGGQAVVSWSAQEIAPGSFMDHYLVIAHPVGAPAKPEITRTVAASGGVAESVAFSGAELAGGTWNWTITPRFRDWTGEAGRKSRNLRFAAVAPAREAAPSASPSTAPSGSPSPAVSSSAPKVTASPVPKQSSKEPAQEPERESETSAPAESAGPPPSPVESTSGEVKPPPTDQ
ncbi:hypothetical protein [Actinoplanes sp. G11-F43]|uniref:hypothetical protein n=1 Tax=Actinoplanes sp. G11-F43 TaxID=3424130 RepID=UPI003D348618